MPSLHPFGFIQNEKKDDEEKGEDKVRSIEMPLWRMAKTCIKETEFKCNMQMLEKAVVSESSLYMPVIR